LEFEANQESRKMFEGSAGPDFSAAATVLPPDRR
jgi:hypothetical protein